MLIDPYRAGLGGGGGGGSLPLTINFNSAANIAALEAEWTSLGVTFSFANTPTLDSFFDPDEIDLPYALSSISGGNYFRVTGGNHFIYLSGYLPTTLTVQKLNLSNLNIILTDNLGGTDTFAFTATANGLFESSGAMALSNGGRHIVSVKFEVAGGSMFLLDDVVFA